MRTGRKRGVTIRVAAATAVLLVAAGAGGASALGGHGPRGGRAAVGALASAARPGTGAVVPAWSAVTGHTAGSGPRGPETAGLGPFRRAWVAVPVATVWNQPHTARPVDAPAVSARPDLSRWVATMAYQQKLGLDYLIATQALLYQPLFVYGHDGDWAHVLVLGQTGSVYPWGIAGWVPVRQLMYTPPPAAPGREVVDVPVLATGGLQLSYGTALPVAGRSARDVTVVLPTGRFSVPASALRPRPLHGSGPAVVAQAERFLGLQYLWAGTSSFGYDCSGLTFSVYRSFGITLPRDAADQARGGVPVGRQDLEPGDLVFFAFGRAIDHVGIYAGHGLMVQAPETGSAVDLVPMWGTWLSRYYAGARRYI